MKGITTVKLNLDEPNIVKTDMQINKLTLMTGMNGIGKSLIMKLIWITNMIGALYYVPQVNKNMAFLKKYCQDLLNGSFDDQLFEGEFGGTGEEFDITVILERGVVKDLLFTEYKDNVAVSGLPIYMSTDTRLYSDITKYFKLMLSMNLSAEEMGKFYKVYDIIFMETIRNKFTGGKDIPQNIRDIMVEQLKKDICHIEIIPATGDIMVTEIVDGIKSIYSATRLSAGEQSWINMTTVGI